MKFSLEHQNPLVAGMVSGSTPLLPAKDSLLKISNPNVILWAIKPPEDLSSKGLIIRLWNVSEEAQITTIQTTLSPIDKAWSTTHIETGEEPLPVSRNGISAGFNKQQIKTFKAIQK